jgi:hypothetical protein
MITSIPSCVNWFLSSGLYMLPLVRFFEKLFGRVAKPESSKAPAKYQAIQQTLPTQVCKPLGIATGRGEFTGLTKSTFPVYYPATI